LQLRLHQGQARRPR
ncbi:hypothetical protein BN1723_019319, partial [Verticillium longisporum]